METRIVQQGQLLHHENQARAVPSVLSVQGNVLTGDVDAVTTDPMERTAARNIEKSLRQLAEEINSAIHGDQHPAVTKPFHDEVHRQHGLLAVRSGSLQHQRSRTQPKGTLDGAISRFLNKNHTLWASLLENHARNTFDPEADKHIAYRDAQGHYAEALSVSPIASAALKSLNLDPYLDVRMSPEDRMKLYHQKIQCQTIQPHNVPHEPELVGHVGVFAKKALPPGEVLGMYTGFLLTREQELPFLPDMHTISVQHDEENIPEPQRFTMIDGRGILSRINTALERNPQGQPIEVAKKACNVMRKDIGIRIQMKDRPTASVVVPFYVTTKKIKNGSELRVDYGYNSVAFNKRFVKPYLQAHPVIQKTDAPASSSSSLKKGKKR